MCADSAEPTAAFDATVRPGILLVADNWLFDFILSFLMALWLWLATLQSAKKFYPPKVLASRLLARLPVRDPDCGLR